MGKRAVEYPNKKMAKSKFKKVAKTDDILNVLEELNRSSLDNIEPELRKLHSEENLKTAEKIFLKIAKLVSMNIDKLGLENLTSDYSGPYKKEVMEYENSLGDIIYKSINIFIEKSFSYAK